MTRRFWALALVSTCAACAQPGAAVSDGAQATTHAPVARWTPDAWSTDQYETTPTFSEDGRLAVFMRADRAFGRYRLMESSCVEGRWTAPLEPAFSADTAMHDGDPFLAPGGNSLYFISTRHRFAQVGNDDFDIYVVARDAGGNWGTPERLPAPVNSDSSELLPSVDRAGHLYFGSARPGGLGGTDIYRATRDAAGNWHVANVVAVNTPANDFEAEVSRDGTRLAVVSDRDLRSRIYLYTRTGDHWVPGPRIHGEDSVFQVGPRFSPDGRRLLFGQDAGQLSGEIYLGDLAADADPAWPPRCDATTAPVTKDVQD
ncbi:TolB family protein [Luteimonas sp. SDU82]|uniref:TolB family protein n=1 Tax=Luteimonas sp. SDU82 TaxID=3422592 RepID=UPI003EBE37E8